MTVNAPLLLDVPEELTTERLFLRPPRPGDGSMVNEAIAESIEELKIWMPWARTMPTREETETWCRQAHVKFLSREQFPWLCFLKENGKFIGAPGIPRLNWAVPKFEIGYWVRTSCVGSGYISEATAKLTEFAFDVLKGRRVEICMDDLNTKSWRIAERLGFELEGILRNEVRDNAGKLRRTRVYAKVRPDEP